MPEDQAGRPIDGMNPVTDPEAGNPLHRTFGELLLRNAPEDSHKQADPPPIVHDVMRALQVAHGLLERFHAPKNVHETADRVGNAFMRLVIDPQYLPTPQATMPDEAPTKEPWQNVARAATPGAEKEMSREPWTTLTFRSASRVQPYIHRNGKGDDDRVLDDAEHGIFGVFDGVGGGENAGGAAEFVRDFVHNALLTATKPASLDEAEQLMRNVFINARTECERLGISGSTTANVTYAIDIDGRNYLIPGNVGDSVLYQAKPKEHDAAPVTTEQLFDKQPNIIFNAIGSDKNKWNDLTDNEIAVQTDIHPDLIRDEVKHIEITPGMRFVHVSDGITGDYEDERLSPSVFGYALHLAEPESTLWYLLDASIKNDDKSGVAFFAEAA